MSGQPSPMARPPGPDEPQRRPDPASSDRRARERAEDALLAAIRAEQSAIEMQERAAGHLRRASAVDRAMADDPATHHHETWQALAEHAEERADAAQRRADAARQRLRQNGIEPGDPEEGSGGSPAPQ